MMSLLVQNLAQRLSQSMIKLSNYRSGILLDNKILDQLHDPIIEAPLEHYWSTILQGKFTKYSGEIPLPTSKLGLKKSKPTVTHIWKFSQSEIKTIQRKKGLFHKKREKRWHRKMDSLSFKSTQRTTIKSKLPSRKCLRLF